MKFWKETKQYYRKLIHSHASPEEVAQGLALGVFIGVTPTEGFQLAIAFFLAAFLKKNEIAAAVGTFITNPITIVPLYYFTYRVGCWMLHMDMLSVVKPDSLRDFFQMGTHLLLPLWAGGVLVGLILAWLSYRLTKIFYPYIRKKQKKLREKISKKLHPPSE